MSTGRSWQDEWGRTWLADSEFTTALDGWVRRRVIEHYEVAERRAELYWFGVNETGQNLAAALVTQRADVEGQPRNRVAPAAADGRSRG